MLVTLKEILNYAEANKCAIGAFHILSEDNLTAVLDAAQELRFPVIIMHSQENEKKLPLANGRYGRESFCSGLCPSGSRHDDQLHPSGIDHRFQLCYL